MKMEPMIANLAQHPTVAAPLTEAIAAINAVHRRPVNLRKVNITSSTAALRAATLSAQLEGLGEQESLSAYSLCGPNLIDATTRTLVRAPLQVIARIDALAGGSGQPESGEGAARLQSLARLIVDGARNQETPAGVLAAVVHEEIYTSGAFGPRTGTIARVTSRLVAVACGFDPRGLCVPEVRWRRRHVEYRTPAALEEKVAQFLLAYVAGAQEAEGIAREVQGA
ncbi:hypothetical protein NQ024_05045 [Corynebacterium sp. 35RC1]|nr:hypothetical protein [Corynebacterium sp. 35RC1]